MFFYSAYLISRFIICCHFQLDVEPVELTVEMLELTQNKK